MGAATAVFQTQCFATHAGGLSDGFGVFRPMASANGCIQGLPKRSLTTFYRHSVLMQLPCCSSRLLMCFVFLVGGHCRACFLFISTGGVKAKLPTLPLGGLLMNAGIRSLKVCRVWSVRWVASLARVPSKATVKILACWYLICTRPPPSTNMNQVPTLPGDPLLQVLKYCKKCRWNVFAWLSDNQFFFVQMGNIRHALSNTHSCGFFFHPYARSAQ